MIHLQKITNENCNGKNCNPQDKFESVSSYSLPEFQSCKCTVDIQLHSFYIQLSLGKLEKH